LLVNSDIVTAFDFRGLVATAPASRPLLVLVPNPMHNARGDFGLDAAGWVCAAPPLLTYSGIGVFDPRGFAQLAPGRRPLKPWLDAAIARRELRGELFSGLWMDVGTPQRLEQARAIALRS
jgi:MurNAc alpha-1-phosphate uridylyltransferase